LPSDNLYYPDDYMYPRNSGWSHAYKPKMPDTPNIDESEEVLVPTFEFASNYCIRFGKKPEWYETQ
jgi:hypothetical protein